MLTAPSSAGRRTTARRAADEYDVLIRFVGPFFGFVAAMRFAGIERPLPPVEYLRELAIRCGASALPRGGPLLPVS